MYIVFIAAEVHQDLDGVNVEEDEAEQDLQNALKKTRRLKQKERKVPVEKVNESFIYLSLFILVSFVIHVPEILVFGNKHFKI